MNVSHISEQVETIVRELIAAGNIRPGQIMVIGTSTSEIAGNRIGTAGSTEIAAAVYEGIERARREVRFFPAYQCCEHLNRALAVEEEMLERYDAEIVTAVPVPNAGGSMAAYAFSQLTGACLVESVSAHAGIDIGDTLIGMHLRRVAVPFRPSVRAIGHAHVTAAYTRPKLIGGARAVYTRE